MTERSLDEMGPVDWMVIEFPPDRANFTGEIADAVVKLHDAGTIRVMDVLFLVKNADGTVDANELSDMADAGELAKLEVELAETLAEEDVATLAEVMAPGTLAAAIIYENLWAAPFGAAVRRAGGQLIANGRIPVQALIAAAEADAAAEAEAAGVEA
jgi:hypothetical protein